MLKLIRLDRTIRSKKPKSNEARLIEEIKIDELEIEIIKSQGFSKELQDLLIKNFSQIKNLTDRKQIYTDGSLAELDGSKIMALDLGR